MHVRYTYHVGDKVFHSEFGEGLVVEIRDRTFYEVLEVVFTGGVKRLSSIHPLLCPKPEVPEAPVKPRRRATLKVVKGGSRDEGKASRLPYLTLDASAERVLERASKRRADPLIDYRLRLEAEELTARRGFETLQCLDHLFGVDQLDYQKEACLQVMREMRGRGLLADEVGLGKTIEAGMILKEYMLRGLVRRVLILVPASLTNQWREELRTKFALDFVIAGRRGDWAQHALLICSLDTAKTARNRDRLLEEPFDLVVVDEAHRLRNHQTLAWKFVAALNSKYLLLLTATPVQNDLRELYNLVNLLRPGTLGTYRSFRRRYMVRGDKRLPKNTAELSTLLRGVMIRTTRAKTKIRFPKRLVNIVHFELTPEERVLYDAVTEFVRERFVDSDRGQFLKWHFVSMVLQKEIGSSTPAAQHTLRRAQSDPRYRNHAGELTRLYDLSQAVRRHAKLEGLQKILPKAGDRAIIFTQFKSTMEFLAGNLRETGYRTLIFHGGMPTADKDAAIEAFRAAPGVLVSTEAGGEGRNLHFCRTVVNYDLPWNPMKVEQRIGRVHRLGQTGDIQIFNMSTEDTVESHVLEILHRKIDMFQLVIGEMDMILGDYAEKKSFEAAVFSIWAGARNRRELERRFRDLGDQMAMNRRRYESIKRLDEEIFGG